MEKGTHASRVGGGAGSAGGGAGIVYSPVPTSSSSSARPGTHGNAAGHEAPTRPSFGQQSCWKRRTFLEKCLMLALLLLFIASVLIVILAVTMSSNTFSKSDSGSPLAALPSTAAVKDHAVCLSEECIRTAARILDAMDKTIDPCEDFFEYACGTWNRVNVIPDDKASYNTFRKLGDELQAILKVLFETSIASNDTIAVKNVKNLYHSCINTTIIEDRNEYPLLSLLNDLGGWPVLGGNWSEDSFQLEELLVKLRLLSNRALMNQLVGADDQNSGVHIIMLDQPQFGMPSRDYFLKSRDDRALMAYESYATAVATSLGANPVTALRDMHDMVDFEIQLANISEPEESRRDAELMYRRYQVSELYTNITNKIDWLRYLNLIFANVSLEISMSEEVIVYARHYLTALGSLLERTPKRTIANYIIWYMTMNRVNNLPQRYLDLRRPINKVLQGTDQEQPRWRTCVNYVNDNLGMAVGRMFVESRFDEASKANAMDMIHNIRASFTELLAEVPWMDDETKKFAKEKADAIQEKIGYPDYIMNDTALNLDYEGVRIDPLKYFENVLTNQNVAARLGLKRLRVPVDRARWSTPPAIVNAFYSPNRNQIMFPAGILQPPFYHGSHPKYLQFSGIAIAVAHEITHGFDDEGRQYNKNGNLKQWWPDTVIKQFKEKAQCIIDQYSNYTVKEAGLNLNGRQTQGENIADNGGLKQAFRAYQRWVERTKLDEDLLPGILLSHEQLFFLNFAQIWCGTARPESYVQSIRVGRHSPGRYRVIGALSNSVDFAKAYNCAVGSPMNPAAKCSVW